MIYTQLTWVKGGKIRLISKSQNMFQVRQNHFTLPFAIFEGQKRIHCYYNNISKIEQLYNEIFNPNSQVYDLKKITKKFSRLSMGELSLQKDRILALTVKALSEVEQYLEFDKAILSTLSKDIHSLIQKALNGETIYPSQMEIFNNESFWLPEILIQHYFLRAISLLNLDRLETSKKIQHLISGIAQLSGLSAVKLLERFKSKLTESELLDLLKTCCRTSGLSMLPYLSNYSHHYKELFLVCLEWSKDECFFLLDLRFTDFLLKKNCPESRAELLKACSLKLSQVLKIRCGDFYFTTASITNLNLVKDNKKFQAYFRFHLISCFHHSTDDYIQFIKNLLKQYEEYSYSIATTLFFQSTLSTIDPKLLSDKCIQAFDITLATIQPFEHCYPAKVYQTYQAYLFRCLLSPVFPIEMQRRLRLFEKISWTTSDCMKVLRSVTLQWSTSNREFSITLAEYMLPILAQTKYGLGSFHYTLDLEIQREASLFLSCFNIGFETFPLTFFERIHLLLKIAPTVEYYPLFFFVSDLIDLADVNIESIAKELPSKLLQTDAYLLQLEKENYLLSRALRSFIHIFKLKAKYLLILEAYNSYRANPLCVRKLDNLSSIFMDLKKDTTLFSHILALLLNATYSNIEPNARTSNINSCIYLVEQLCRKENHKIAHISTEILALHALKKNTFAIDLFAYEEKPDLFHSVINTFTSPPVLMGKQPFEVQIKLLETILFCLKLDEVNSNLLSTFLSQVVRFAHSYTSQIFIMCLPNICHDLMIVANTPKMRLSPSFDISQFTLNELLEESITQNIISLTGTNPENLPEEDLTSFRSFLLLVPNPHLFAIFASQLDQKLLPIFRNWFRLLVEGQEALTLFRFDHLQNALQFHNIDYRIIAFYAKQQEVNPQIFQYFFEHELKATCESIRNFCVLAHKLLLEHLRDKYGIISVEDLNIFKYAKRKFNKDQCAQRECIQLIKLIKNLHVCPEDPKKIQILLNQLQEYFITHSVETAHLSALSERLKEYVNLLSDGLQTQSIKNLGCRWTHNPLILFSISDLVSGSCQAVLDKNPANKALVSRLTHGKQKMLMFYDHNTNAPLAVMTTKLLRTETDKPVILREFVYRVKGVKLRHATLIKLGTLALLDLTKDYELPILVDAKRMDFEGCTLFKTSHFAENVISNCALTECEYEDLDRMGLLERRETILHNSLLTRVEMNQAITLVTRSYYVLK